MNKIRLLIATLLMVMICVCCNVTIFAGYVPYKILSPDMDTYIDSGKKGEAATEPNRDKSFGTSKTLFLSPVQDQFANRANARTSYGLMRFDISNWTEDDIKNAACIKLRLTTCNDVDETRTGFTGGAATSIYSIDYRLVAANDDPIKNVLQVLGLQRGIELIDDIEKPINYKTSWNEQTTWNSSGGLKFFTIGNMLRGATVDPVRKNTTYYIDVTDYVVFNKLYDSDIANRNYAAFKIQKMIQNWGWNETKFGDAFSIHSNKADNDDNKPALILYTNDAKGKLQIIADNFNLGDIRSVVSNITFATNTEGANIAWKSNTPSVISNAGAITMADTDRDFELEATFTKDGETITKIFKGTVKSRTYITEALNEISKTLSFDKVSAQPINMVTSNLSLISTLAPQYPNVRIKWNSEKPNVISETGVVVRPTNDTVVAITATLIIEGLENYPYYVYFSPIVLGTNPSSPIIRDGNEPASGSPPQPTNPTLPTTATPPINTSGASVTLENMGKKQLFSDVPIVFWGAKFINFLKDNSIVSGDENGLYNPNNAVTIEESLKLIIEALKFNHESQTSGFVDVAMGSWYAPYIATGKGLSIVNGISETNFGVGQSIRRQDLAVMIYNALKLKNTDTSSENPTLFTDDKNIDHYAKPAVYFLKQAGILSGVDTGEFLPQNTATRAEIAKILATIIIKFNLYGEMK